MDMFYIKSRLKPYDLCPSCGKRKLKENEKCFNCRKRDGLLHSPRGMVSKNEHLHYCQNSSCEHRYFMFKQEQMITYLNFYFCSEKCQKIFIKNMNNKHGFNE